MRCPDLISGVVGLSEGKSGDGVGGGYLRSVEVTVEKSACRHQF